MDIKQLNYFKSIVEQGGISAAARAVNIAQPVLSRALQALESELGQALLTRSKTGVTLTEQGEIFYQKVKNLIAAYEGLVEDPFNLKPEPKRGIRYGRTKYWSLWPLMAFHDALSEATDLDI